MEDPIQGTWNQLRDSVSTGPTTSVGSLAISLIVGGLLSLYIRFLYRRYGTSASDTDSITRVFPLLTLVTIAVIAVVKSSMALSLGLVGALSIVRFRSAIKEPEELVYLFLCIGVGLALGASQFLLALVLVVVSSGFIVVMSLVGLGRNEQCLMLTITGDAGQCFQKGPGGVLNTLSTEAGDYLLQRLDVESERAQVRVLLRRMPSQQVACLIQTLRERLPGCEFSYVNLRTIL
jgi:hypothetical protein